MDLLTRRAAALAHVAFFASAVFLPALVVVLPWPAQLFHPTSSACTAQVAPDRLVVTRTRNNVGNPAAPPFSKTIADRSAVEELYADIAALPPLPAGPLNCPNDVGVSYRLDFYSGTETVLFADYQPTGCASVRLSDGAVKGDPTRSFGVHLRQMLGLSESAFLGFG
jgi:hypothetical protein